MARDNVVPIDAEAARLLDQRTTRFRWFVGAVTGVWLLALVPVLAFTPLPPIAPFAVLAVLVVLAEHRFVLFGDETSMSASIVVVVASIFVFADTAPLAGPILIASLGGLYLPHVRHRRTTVCLANVTIFGIAAAVASAAASGLGVRSSDTALRIALVSLVGVGSYWLGNSVLIGAASALRNGSELGASIRVQVSSEWRVLVLSLGAALLACSLGADEPAALTAIAIPLATFEWQVRRANRTGKRRQHDSFPIQLGTLIALSAILVTAGVRTGLAAFFIGTFVCLSIARGEGRPATCVAIAGGVTVVLAVALRALALPPGASVALLAIVATGLLALAQLRHSSRLLARRIDYATALGVMLPSRADAAYAALLAGIAAAALRLSTTATAHVMLLAIFALGSELLLVAIKATGRHSAITAQRSSASVSR